MLFAELLPWFPVSSPGVQDTPALSPRAGLSSLPCWHFCLTHPRGAGAPSPGGAQGLTAHTEMWDQYKTTQEHPGASLDPVPWNFINNRDWRTQQTPKEQKTPSAEQGPPATAGFETGSTSRAERAWDGPKVVPSSHCTEEIPEEIPAAAPPGKAKGKHKSCLLSFGRGALNTARGAPQQTPDPPGWERTPRTGSKPKGWKP